MKNTIVIVSLIFLAACGGGEKSVEDLVNEGDVAALKAKKSELTAAINEDQKKLEMLNAALEGEKTVKRLPLVSVYKIESQKTFRDNENPIMYFANCLGDTIEETGTYNSANHYDFGNIEYCPTIPNNCVAGFMVNQNTVIDSNGTTISAGIVITASHNPPTYNGYKLKGSFGGPLSPENVQEVEDMIPEVCEIDYLNMSLENQSGLEYYDMEALYIQAIKDNFDLEAIKNSGLKTGNFETKINCIYDGNEIEQEISMDVTVANRTFDLGISQYDLITFDDFSLTLTSVWNEKQIVTSIIFI